MMGKRKRYSAEFKGGFYHQFEGDGRDHGADVPDRRAVPGDTLVWFPADGATAASREGMRLASSGPAADDRVGSGANLPASSHDDPASARSDPSLAAAWLGGGLSEPGLVCEYYKDAVGEFIWHWPRMQSALRASLRAKSRRASARRVEG